MNVVHKWIKLKEDWSENQVCARCKIVFTQYGNAGRWQCSFHPGEKVVKDESHRIYSSGGSVPAPITVWSCCGRSWTSTHEMGCVPCDHTTGRLRLDERDVIPNIHESWVKELRCIAGAVVEDKQKPGWVIIKKTK